MGDEKTKKLMEKNKMKHIRVGIGREKKGVNNQY